MTHSLGKKAWVEAQTTTVIRVRDLPCDWWTPQGSTSAANSIRFQPKPVIATLVRQWDGAPKGAEKDVVILDTDPPSDAFAGFDAYDDRSVIKNTCNREAKGSWFLEHHPKRSEASMRTHAYFVFTCMALVAAFRLHQQQAEAAEVRGKETGIGRLRRQLEAKNRERVIVFCGERLGLFRNYEVNLLVGIASASERSWASRPRPCSRAVAPARRTNPELASGFR